MKFNSKHLSYGIVGTFGLGLAGIAVASPQGTGGTLTRFVAGQVAVAEEVNDNFSLVLDAAERADAAAAEARSVADTANSAADLASQRASDALTKANSVESLATGANATSVTALDNANEALAKANSVEGIANTANSTAASANSTAQSAETKADQALTKANSVEGLASSANAAAASAQAKADEALTKANSVEGIANTANTNAQSAQSDASDALSEVNMLSAEVTPLLDVVTGSGSRLGVNEDTPLARNHIVGVDIGVIGTHLSNDVLVVESIDAVASLISNDSGSLGSVLALREVNNGAVFSSQWAMARGVGVDGALKFMHGTDPNLNSNSELMTLLPNGNLGLGEGSPTATLDVNGESILGSRSAVNGSINPNARFSIDSSDPAFGNISFMVGEFGPGADMVFDGGVDGVSGIEFSAPGGQFHIDSNTGRVMHLEANGSVGIGTSSPAHLLSVNGSAGKPGGGSWSTFSDARLKKNVRGIDGALATLLSLRGVQFEYIDPDSVGELEGERLGFIAQEVEDVLPDWVEENASGYKQLTVRGFEALAVESLRELTEQNKALEQELEQLRERVASLEAVAAQVASLTAAVELMSEGR